jgi:AraC family transcriptional regulator of adaptative response / DNA-3-methyladenine glycosylase II
VRQFNDTIRQIFAFSPSEIRRRSTGGSARLPGTLELRLSLREPFDGAGLLRFLERRAVAGIEEVSGTTYRRALRLGFGSGVVELTPESRLLHVLSAGIAGALLGALAFT